MNADNFIDSNILVYFLDKTESDKQHKAEILIEQAIGRKKFKRTGCCSIALGCLHAYGMSHYP